MISFLPEEVRLVQYFAMKIHVMSNNENFSNHRSQLLGTQFDLAILSQRLWNVLILLYLALDASLEDGEHRRLSDGEAHREATLHRAVLGNGDDIVRNGDDGRV